MLALLIATWMTAYPRLTGEWWFVAALVTCLALLAVGSSMIWKPQSKWYESRAIAESVKTMSWRYLMKAKPFEGPDVESRRLLLERMQKVLSEHKDLAGSLTPVSGVGQITGAMEQARKMDAASRLSLYVSKRVTDQGGWYVKRARQHKARLYVLLGLFVVAVSIAIVLLFHRAIAPAQSSGVVDLAVSFALALLAWLQATKYPETITSYSLTAHEIGIVEAKAADVVDDASLSEYVSGAENAFSREHTQWIARQDS